MNLKRVALEQKDEGEPDMAIHRFLWWGENVLNFCLNVIWTHPALTSACVYLASEDGEGQPAGLAELPGAPWAGGGVGRVPCAGGKAEGPRPCSEARLRCPHRSRAHHLVQQPAAWRPHGRRPRLPRANTHIARSLAGNMYPHILLMLQSIACAVLAQSNHDF